MKEYLEECWEPLDVEGCAYRYDISNYGRVRDKVNDVMVSQVLTGKPQYYYVNLQPIQKDGTKGKRLLRRVHNLLAKVFIPNNNATFTMVDHIDRNKYNNSLDNLRWCCRKDNARNMDSNLKLGDGRMVRDVCEEEGLPLYLFTSRYYRNGNALSTDEIYRITYNKYFMTFKGDKRVRSEVEDLIGLDNKTLKYLLGKGYSYECIYDKGYKYVLEEKEYHLSLEVYGKWFPNKETLCKYFNVSRQTVGLREKEGETLESALLPRDRKDTSRKLIYKGEEHTFKSLEEVSGIPSDLISDRLNTKGWSIEDAVETPIQKVKFYYLNGVRMSKKSMLEKLGIKNTKSFNSYQSKTGLAIVTILEEKYKIDLSGYKISLTP